ncbi:metallophosphoesterase family protein [Planosporangium thailandense]|uniref:metallophosphoesterase family protein n=1 Tax=Planosporangium thailandense TaxID=765197 RepID=UPI00197C4850|nr:hypothetical protein [Planosporangium thailandense]
MWAGQGASGAVDDVWLAFAAAGCPWIIGVAGNHDVVSPDDLRDLGPTAALLDGIWADRGAVRFAGDPPRPGCSSENLQLATIDAVLASNPDVLVLHEGPPGNRAGQPGNPAIGARLRAHPPALTVCGHVHWDTPMARLGDGYVLNVDDRAVILRSSR